MTPESLGITAHPTTYKKPTISEIPDIDLIPEMKIAVKSEDYETAAKLKNEGERRGLDMTI